MSAGTILTIGAFVMLAVTSIVTMLYVGLAKGLKNKSLQIKFCQLPLRTVVAILLTLLGGGIGVRFIGAASLIQWFLVALFCCGAFFIFISPNPRALKSWGKGSGGSAFMEGPPDTGI